MKFQDASRPSVKSYQVVRNKADSLLDFYGDAVTYRAGGLDVSADNETTGVISELVGIGAGLAAACEAFDLNPNRISRFISTATGKRMDYQFTVGQQSYLLEVRGTTGVGTQKGMIAAVGPKKSAPTSLPYAAHAGAVTLYNQGDGEDYVVLVDPPQADGEADENEELATILEYYHNVYRLSHSSEALIRNFKSWIDGVRGGEVTELPPPPSREEIPDHRVSVEVPGIGTVRGTMFDRRILQSAVRRFGTFEEATAKVTSPTWLYGTLVELDEIIAAGDWAQLISYSAPPDPEDLPLEATLLRSGVAIVPMQLERPEERVLSASFRTLKRTLERSGDQ